MTEATRGDRDGLFNPFVGLRPFEEREAHLFFGRDGQSDELVRRLALHRFVAVVGVSGSGKSSLVRAGLLPSLHGGFMAKAGSSWRIALLRPGSAPMGSLASALHETATTREPALDDTPSQPVIEATLRRSSLGLIDAVRQARFAAEDNVLIVIDQFEELFRFRSAAAGRTPEGDGAAFVKLLLEASQQSTLPIYVMLTMRSDFLGECAQFRGLPEAMNESQYLIPRMNRDERRLAIEGPVAVGGGRIAARLVQRLLNDVGEDPDQLPVLQHSLMRTWQHWRERTGDRGQLDLVDYEAIGTMSRALSMHADEAYGELESERERTIAEKTFKRLTERGHDGRETRRPTDVEELRAVADAELSEVTSVIDRFRNPVRSFLMPPSDAPLHNYSVIDISHESLIRKWSRLKAWVEEETESRAMYLRVDDAAERHAAGRGGLWRNPDLKLALRWLERERPNAAWARRYGKRFDLVDDFLRRSRHQGALIRGGVIAAVIALVCLTAISIVESIHASNEQRRAEAFAQRQQEMTRIALNAVRALTYDVPEKLTAIPGTTGVINEIFDENIRMLEQINAVGGQNQAATRELASNALKSVDLMLRTGQHGRARVTLEKIRPQLELLITTDPDNPNWKRDLSIYHERMGNVLMAQSDRVGALREYRDGLRIVQSLLSRHPGNESLLRGVSIGHEKIGDALLANGDADGALREYTQDFDIARELAARDPNAGERQIDVAISHERMADALAKLGKGAEADDHARRAKAIRASVGAR